MENKSGFASIAVIIAIVVIATGLGYFAFKNQTQSPPEPKIECGGISGIACPAGYTCITNPKIKDSIGYCKKEVFKTQGDCEAGTGKSCTVQLCDYAPPGKTIEEVCGKDFKKGWVPIPNPTSTAETAQILSCPKNQTYNDVLQKCDTKIENEIKSLLPKGALLREVKPIPDFYSEEPQVYIGIYIENPKINPPPSEIDYYTCPLLTSGQSIEGIYHFFLYQDSRVFGDKTLPEGLHRNGYPWKNAKSNNFDLFNSPTIPKKEKGDLELTQLINFAEYNGDYNKHEFIFYGDYQACGHNLNLVAGYDDQAKQIIFYPIITRDRTVNWYDNFKPSRDGSVKWMWPCGDHGAETGESQLFSFDKTKKAYILVKETTSTCY